MKYFIVSITPASAGFGEYEAAAAQPGEDELWDNEAELTENCMDDSFGDVYMLGRDELPIGVEDIRGKIRNEPRRGVFAVVYDDPAQPTSYFGIDRT